MERFTERYFSPLTIELHFPDKKKEIQDLKHGFATMAICCLMIETLQSFRNGWSNSRGKSELAFCQFFDQNSNFIEFRGQSSNFYKSVRCGILHQGETTKGWRIRRKGFLFNQETKTINATKFHQQLFISLENYSSDLKNSEWDSEIG